MARYIDAENMYKEVWKRSTSPLNEWDTWGVLNVLDMVKTEDVAPIVHAHWTNKRTDIHDGEFYCSHCGVDALWLSDNVQATLNPYCHRCGAKMDEEKEG